LKELIGQSMQKMILFTVIMFLLFSCEKTPESYVGKNMDVDLIGTWCKTYSTRDFHNSITIFTDTIRFGLNNSGSQVLYQFTKLEYSSSFQYFTDNNLVYLRPDGMEDANHLMYIIQNDSLFLSEGIPYIKSVGQ
jgi:hypothetical protein